MKKQFYLKPEIYVINAEPEMLLAGSGEIQQTEQGKSVGSSDDEINSWNGDWTSGNNGNDEGFNF